MLSWSGILLAGILFAFTAESVDLVIRSTVSVMFVLNIDEIVFEVIECELVLSRIQNR